MKLEDLVGTHLLDAVAAWRPQSLTINQAKSTEDMLGAHSG